MSNKSGIPSWQRPQATTSQSPPSLEPESKPESQESEEANLSSDPEEAIEEEKDESRLDSSALLEQASKFLEDPTIRDAPWDKKVIFLRSKGVRDEELEKLREPQPEISITNMELESERAWPKTTSQPAPPPALGPQPRDMPPIVTYPEFLVQSSKPPPLITARRIATTAYIAGGLISAIYGLSQFVVAPMTQTLAETRHDFATHTKEQLEELNSRLGDVVSVDPATKPNPKIIDVSDEVSEADSDPTELYHRDFGTQTTPTLSRRPSVSIVLEEEPVVAGHESRLKIMTSHLKELEATRSNDTASADSLKTNLSDLTTYLSEMSYQNQYYSGMGGMYGNNYGVPKSKDGKDDQMEVLKSDIRAVKGVLLSARNFPAGGRNTPPVGRVSG